MLGRAPSLEALVKSRLPSVLGEVLGEDPSRVRVRASTNRAYDLRAEIAGRAFLIEVVGRATPQLINTWDRVSDEAKKRDVALVVVPFMTSAGRTLCRQRGINWVDLAGNADVRVPGLQLHIEGRPDRFVPKGRPASVFERRSSRLARVLLQHPGRVWSVRECARESGLNEGHVSRIVARLVQDDFLRSEGRRLRVVDPALLLDAWRESAEFEKHRILRGHVPARSGEELLRVLSGRLSDAKLDHAATGLGAAWQYDHFALFRLVTFFVHEWPAEQLYEKLHFREEPNGGNTWLVLPADDGVFEGAQLVDGVRCVHPVQVYVDLKGHPERANEAAVHLRQRSLVLG